MRVSVVGFPYSGKTSVFCAVTGIPRDHLRPGEENVAAVKVPEPRLDFLFEMFKPRRKTEASIDFVDLPGSVEGASERAGLSRHMPTLRQSDALLIVLRAFRSESVPAHGDRVDCAGDLRQLRDEMLLADLESCSARVEKLEKAIAKHGRDQDQLRHELGVLLRCREALESERPLREVVEPGDEEKLLRSFGFLTQKPVVVVVNIDEQDIGKEPPLRDSQAAATLAVCAPLEAELILLDPADRGAFMAEYGIQALARNRIVRACFDALGMICFFTAVGSEEVRAWAIPAGSTAVEAAGKVHSDMARGFIRAETISFDDLRAAGSLRQAKATNKIRQEPRHYIVQDGDVITFKFSV